MKTNPSRKDWMEGEARSSKRTADWEGFGFVFKVAGERKQGNTGLLYKVQANFLEMTSSLLFCTNADSREFFFLGELLCINVDNLNYLT